MNGKTENKKSLFGKKILFTSLFVFLGLVASIVTTPKNNQAFAQSNSCEVTEAIMTPSSTGAGWNSGSNDHKFGETFYQKRGSDGAPVKIEVGVQNCKDQTISVDLIQGPVDVVPGFVSTISKQTSKDYDDGVGPYYYIETDEKTVLTYNFLAANYRCSPSAVKSDCHYHFRVFGTPGRAPKYSVSSGSIFKFNGQKNLYESKDDELYGNLYFDFEGSDYLNWVYKGANSTPGELTKPWYYKLNGGTWSKSKYTTKDDCEKLDRDTAPGADKSADCRQDPPVDELTEGTVSGVSSAVPECNLNPADPDLAACITDIAHAIIFYPVAVLAGMAGSFFDVVFEFSINSAVYGGGGYQVGFLKTGWTFVRDVANLGFIITLLWLAINQIIIPQKTDLKKALPTVIIVALLINFSFFIGSFLVDVTNVLARFLFTNDVICVNTNGACDGTISEAIVAAFNPQNIVQQSSGEYQRITGNEKMSVGEYAIILFMSILVVFKMAKAFFKMATLFLGRIVQIWVHLVLSPIAFINMILPKKIAKDSKFIKADAQSWAGELFKNAMIAPVFMFFMYLLLLVVSGFNFAKLVGSNDSKIITLITLFVPFFVIMLLIDALVDATQKQAGFIAEKATGLVNKVIGGVVGTTLGLAAMPIAGAATKFGSRALSNLGQKWVGREGKGSNAVSRSINRRFAKLGGRLNEYSKKLPDKKMDIRENKWISGKVKDVTGFDLGQSKNAINKNLSYVGLRPNESFNERNARREKTMEDDIKRRQIATETDKMDSELVIEQKARLAKMNEKMLEDVLTQNNRNKEHFVEYAKNRRLAGEKDEEKILNEFLNSPLNSKIKIDFEELKNKSSNIYKEKVSGSVELFDADSRDKYKKAAEKYNDKVREDFIYSKKRDVYGGETRKETDQNMKDNKQTMAGFANIGDVSQAGLQTTSAATLAGGIIGAGAAGIAGVAGAAIYGANANSKRDSDLAFLRKMENKKYVDEKKETKIKKEIEKQQISNDRLEIVVADLAEKLQTISSSLKQNNDKFISSIDNQEKSLKTFFESATKEIKDREGISDADMDKKWTEKLESEAFKESFVNFIKESNQTIRDLQQKISETTNDVVKKSLQKQKEDLELVLENMSKNREAYFNTSNDYEKKFSALNRGKDRKDKLGDSLKGKPADKKPDTGDKNDGPKNNPLK